LSENIIAFVHVAALPATNKVLQEIQDSITSSRLDHACEKIYFIVVGNPSLIDLSIIDNNKYCIIYYSNQIDYCEFPTLAFMHLLSQSYDGAFAYFHTKGVTRQSESVDNWREMLMHFNIDLWRERLEDLKYFDTSGVNLLGDKDNYANDPRSWANHPDAAPLHYSGNFWWATSEYVRGLPSPMSGYTPSDDWGAWRHMCEMWLCYTQGGSHHCAHWSGVDHYYQKYPANLYGKQGEKNDGY
jgi:hypothetical protein